MTHILRRQFVAALAAVTGLALVTPVAPAAAASKIERIVSPSGLVAWLVREPAVPLIALDFAFAGGANADPADKPGVANMVGSLLDEGAGELNARAFHERLEERAIEMNFSAARDQFRGSLRMLSENRDEAAELLRLALTSARFDAEPVEVIRAQVLNGLQRGTTNPNDIASRRWWSTAFPGHPYGRPSNGTIESVPTITIADLKSYTQRVFAREKLTIAIVGDIDAKAAGELIDKVFAKLPAKPDLPVVADVSMKGLGERIVVDLDVPQTVVTFGGPGIQRKDPDFFAAYIVNHILGGGTMSSRLYQEVREKRGLAYGISSALIWFDHAAIMSGRTATRGDRAGETLAIIDQEIRRMAESGPTEDELAKAKAYLKGSYALAFDTSGKIAGQLVQIQLDGLGMDYVDRRSGLIDAVTLEDARRVAKRLLDTGMLVGVVGRAQGLTPAKQGG
jgi:zinc protease